MAKNIEEEWKHRMMEDAQHVYGAIDRKSGSILVRMIAAQLVTERAIFSGQNGGQHSLRVQAGYALEPLVDDDHFDRAALQEHAWCVLRSDRPHLRNLIPSINRCLARCEGNDKLREVVRLHWL